MSRRAVTLLELLVVIAIIGVLCSLLLPVLTRAKASAKSTACLGNLHQIGLGFQLYVQDNMNHMPRMYDRSTNVTDPPKAWFDQVMLPFVGGNSNVFKCPADEMHLFDLTLSSYGWNFLLNGEDADHLQMLSTQYDSQHIFIMLDKAKFHAACGETKAVNYLYADGHIRNIQELQGSH
jgi:prepilin-type N-terminal cleavage/methylation domain-containing protein/prepilin-type processing-associated H-X9-DG protein